MSVCLFFCLWTFSTARLLNLYCVIVNRSLRAAEKDLSPAALVAGFTLTKFTDRDDFTNHVLLGFTQRFDIEHFEDLKIK